MLSEKEEQFIRYWEKVRVEQSGFWNKLLSGMPVAVLFSLPILFSVVAVNIFSPEWFTKISQKAMTATYSILVAVVICIFFFSYFRMQFKWEMNEQLYRELLSKKSKNKES